ncbi:MAG: hypothetical protein IPM34_12420 [Saprospiraceae bacterium]|nr:hypothetical protein [Saprospiraceae bacterium]
MHHLIQKIVFGAFIVRKLSGFIPVMRFGLIVFFMLQFNTGHTTHIVGGDIGYRCLGNNLYEITLTLRRDCINGNPGAQFDNPASMGIFDRQGRLQSQLGNVGRLLMQFRQDDTLNEVLSKSCGIIGGDVCVHTTTYVDTIELPFLVGGYILSYQRCCRNFTIRNIVDPLASGATYTLEITEESLLQCNASPLLGPYPPIYICGGQAIAFDLKARDEDGDSLVYKMCTPYLGADQLNPRPATPSNPPYDFVIFSGNYSLNDMIGGIPPLNISPSSGFMSGFAEPVIAQYLIAYCVEEYRNGKLLSTLRRDFQINVRLCNSTPHADFDLNFLQCLNPFKVQLQNNSTDLFSSLEKYFWEFRINGQVQRSDLKDPEFVSSETGILEIQLIVESKEMCRDTILKKFVLDGPELDFNFRTDTICLLDSVELVKVYDPDYMYEWSPLEGLTCVRCPNPKAGPVKNTRYILRTYNATCETFDTVDVIVKPCTIDPCAIFLESECLPNGMIQISALDGNARLVQPRQRDRELFWNIQKHSNHPEYTIQNQNPILLYESDVFSLTYKYYSWPPGRPKSIEYADICQQKFQDTVKLNCSGPCSELQFILASCEDDYHKQFNLNYPTGICKTICGGACQFIIALFETDGRLINPSDYEINWSNGTTGSYVELMAPYFNNLSVSVKKGDCFWKGKYIKSCQSFGQWQNDPDQLISLKYRKGSGTGTLVRNCSLGVAYYRLSTLDGRTLTNDLSNLDRIESGIYLLTEEVAEMKWNYLLMIE